MCYVSALGAGAGSGASVHDWLWVVGGRYPASILCMIESVRLAAGEGESSVGLHLSQIAEADELLTSDPLALLIGMVLDQQIG